MTSMNEETDLDLMAYADGQLAPDRAAAVEGWLARDAQAAARLAEIRDQNRLLREAESNVAIKVTESADKDSFEVAGRGELQLGVLIETMRREGFELTVSRLHGAGAPGDDVRRPA